MIGALAKRNLKAKLLKSRKRLKRIHPLAQVIADQETAKKKVAATTAAHAKMSLKRFTAQLKILRTRSAISKTVRSNKILALQFSRQGLLITEICLVFYKLMLTKSLLTLEQSLKVVV